MAEKRNYNKKPVSPAPVAPNEFGKLPPQAPELEEDVLGAIMLEKDAYASIADILKPDFFYKTAHQKIYEAVVDLALHQNPIDMHTSFSFSVILYFFMSTSKIFLFSLSPITYPLSSHHITHHHIQYQIIALHSLSSVQLFFLL